ncbi:MAG: o-succinylbenzoate synthase [Chloroflexi bacterium 13_1_40CM_3_65_12]|nr:MAG: o-succinylbenzoate synthase [Actinobacteria bacterium 13_1_40CM_4_65_12]OLD24721.1 MAG: o-succinylbenzoate synthase [Chloroflexi bacterium 13_1_40CM_3_65_12]OLD50564.1 MAG: o-succinylbenzoate synthase [Actinobacteria bacterium 13_1_40CM_2_65_8]
MKLDGVELRRIRISLVAPFETSFGTQSERDILLVKAVTDEGEGWGECVAGEEPDYSSEYVEAAQHVLIHHLLDPLLEKSSLTAADVGVTLRRIHGHRMAKASIEMALLDAELRARRESFAHHFGAVRSAVDSGVSVGIHPSIPALLATVGAYLEQGYRRIKLKIKPGWDVEPVKAVRERFGDVPLQVDANTAYMLGDARHLAELDVFNLLLIEQPLPEEQVLAHAELAKIVRTPICLDESITSEQAAADAIQLGACQIINIKPGRVGGYLEAKRIHHLCAEHGIPVWMGGMLETGLGRAGNVAMAAMPNFTLPGDTSASDRYYHRDITEPFVLVDGRLNVPDGPGLGVNVDLAYLDEITTSVQLVRRREGRAVRVAG